MKWPVLLTLMATASVAHSQDLAAKFGARPSFSGAALSPDGSKVSYIVPVAGKGSSLAITDIAKGETKRVLSTGDPNLRMRSCYWAKIDQLICDVSAESNVVGQLLGFSRVVAVDANGGGSRVIGRRSTENAYSYNQNSGDVIDTLPDDPDNVLMSIPQAEEFSTGTVRSAKKAGLTAQLVDLRTGRARRIAGPFLNGSFLLSDNRGNVRVKGSIEMIERADYGSQAAKTMEIRVRSKSGGDWLPFATVDLTAAQSLEIIGYDDTGDWLYYLAPKDGRLVLYRTADASTATAELVGERPDVDIDGLDRIGKYSRPIGYTYSGDYNHVVYFDTVLEKLSQRLKKVLPGNPAVQILDETWDGSKLMLFAGSDVDPGSYYLFDKATKQLGKLSGARPDLDGLTLATMKPISFVTRDGTQVPGYLTLPPGKEPRNLPVIVMPHGGPSSRDYWGFNWLPQYFSQLGYAVLQPNYRGSAGFGEGWFQENGFKSWRTAMDDINDGARWLAAQGIGDAKRMAIVGWSYGGYAALQANVADPALYRAAIAIAPVTDLTLLLDRARDFTSFAIVRDFVGTGPHVMAGSPARNAAAIRPPVLMFHGTKDLNVQIEQSRFMAKAFRDAGKAVELVEYPDLQHSLIDSTARADMLRRSAAFLEANLK